MINKILLLVFIFLNISAQSASLSEKLDDRSEKSRKRMPEDVKKIFNEQNETLIKSKIVDLAVKKGVMVPNFNLDDKNIKSFYKKNNLIITFYRGAWCPYCMIELKEYQNLYSKIKESGCELVAISPDVKMEIKKMKKKFDLEFPIYSDQNNKIAKKFGIAFTLNENIVPIYKKFGIDLKKSQGNSANQLPLPGTYVINKDGKIIYAYTNVDYTKRAEPKEVISYCNK